MREQPASQSRREACFWHVADAWGLGQWVPRCDLVQLGGREYAAIEMLPSEWRNALGAEELDKPAVLRALERYRTSGVLHQWAALDYVLGNPDRHAQNVMVSPEWEMRLIDHGSAFAGPDFDPARDRNSFVPYYLRAQVPAGEFARMTPHERLARMPVLGTEAERSLRAWLDGLDWSRSASVMRDYGVDPGASAARFARLRAAPGPAHVAVCALWVTT